MTGNLERRFSSGGRQANNPFVYGCFGFEKHHRQKEFVHEGNGEN